MKTKLKTELPIITIVILPFLYLAWVWNDLPESLPVHWNINGEADRYGSKEELILLPFILPVLTYLIFLIGPIIDPKKKMPEMGPKLQKLKFWLCLLMSVLAIGIIYLSANQVNPQPSFMISTLGFLYLILGNFFKTIKPNYFIGLRTPWTLESEKVWKLSHELAGKLFFIGGLFIIFIGFILETRFAMYLFIGITILISVIPVIYSYRLFQGEKRNEKNS